MSDFKFDASIGAAFGGLCAILFYGLNPILGMFMVGMTVCCLYVLDW